MRLRRSDSYAAKSAFFDDQVRQDWTTRDYSLDERRKLDRLFALIGPLAGLRLLEPGCGTGRLTEIKNWIDDSEGYLLIARLI